MTDSSIKKRSLKLTFGSLESNIINNEDCTTPSTNSSFADDRYLNSSFIIKSDHINEPIVISPDSVTVIETLGRGQYGVVERVIHNQSQQQFALKRVMLTSNLDDEKRNFLTDVDFLANIDECANIIKFYGHLDWEGDSWIFMELMELSMDKFYRIVHSTAPIEEKPFPERALGKISSDIINALSYLYSLKIIHRDVKPSNILVNREGIVKLCDFGISGFLVNSIAKTTDAGCRPYMAPERIDPPKDSEGYDIRSDIWSLGITIIELATGQYPYNKARNFFEQLTEICKGKPPQLPHGIFSIEINDFINTCLQHNYKLRPKYDVLDKHQFIIDYKGENIANFVLQYVENGQ